MYNTDARLRTAFQERRLDNELSRRMVNSVDRSVVEGNRFGGASPVAKGQATLTLDLSCDDR